MKEARLRAKEGVASLEKERMEKRTDEHGCERRKFISAYELPFLSKLVLFSSLFKMSLIWTKAHGLKINNINQVSH